MVRIISVQLIAALSVGLAALLPAAPVAAQNAPARLADNAPDSHVVVPGDTLWGISGRFLKEPWRWPEVWRMNREQIRNPHLIYPGQIVVLDRSGPYLRLGRRVGGSPGADRVLYEKRFPQAYSTPLGAQAIASIPYRVIAPFLVEPLVVDAPDEAQAGILVATQEGRVFTGPGDAIFATRIDPQQPLWNVYRKASPLREPVTGELLGFQATFLGTARLASPALEDGERPQPAQLQIVTAKQEIGKGDRLLPAPPPELLSFVPHAPEQDLAGRVVSVHDGVAETGRFNVISVSLGKRDGLEVGHVLALYRNRGEAVYREDNVGPAQRYRLPEERYGLAFVFRVFDRVGYALVMESTGPVTVADSARKP